MGSFAITLGITMAVRRRAPWSGIKFFLVLNIFSPLIGIHVPIFDRRSLIIIGVLLTLLLLLRKMLLLRQLLWLLLWHNMLLGLGSLLRTGLELLRHVILILKELANKILEFRQRWGMHFGNMLRILKRLCASAFSPVIVVFTSNSNMTSVVCTLSIRRGLRFMYVMRDL